MFEGVAKLAIAKTAEVLELEDLSLSLLRRSMKAPRVTTTTASKSSPIDSLSFAVNLIFPFFDSPACGLVHVATTVSLTTCTSFNPFELPLRALTSGPVLESLGFAGHGEDEGEGGREGRYLLHRNVHRAYCDVDKGTE
jgi:hypothetical protein